MRLSTHQCHLLQVPSSTTSTEAVHLSSTSVESGYASHTALIKPLHNQHYRSNTSVADQQCEGNILISGSNESSHVENKGGVHKHPNYLHSNSVKEHGRSNTFFLFLRGAVLANFAYCTSEAILLKNLRHCDFYYIGA